MHAMPKLPERVGHACHAKTQFTGAVPAVQVERLPLIAAPYGQLRQLLLAFRAISSYIGPRMPRVGHPVKREIHTPMNDCESQRLQVLQNLNLLDTPPSEHFDRITRMARQLFNLPIAAVSLTDRNRQWFKSRLGVDHTEIPRHKACCAEVTQTSNVLVVPDLLESETYHDSNLAASGIRFYAGAPLTTRDGYTLGAMCVLGHEPRNLTEAEQSTLNDLAAMVMDQVELQHAVGRVDPNTGLPNLNQFIDDVEDLARDRPGADYFALSTELIDLSQASASQRVMGPSYLDHLSRAASERFGASLAPGEKVYHIGPCQFAQLKTGTKAEVMRLAQSLRATLLGLELGDTSPYLLRPVIGVAPFKTGDARPADVIRLAHSASRDARHAERGTGFYSSSSDASHQRRFNLLTQFRTALTTPGQLRLVYQPRIDLASGRCVGAESLLRWDHPEFGPISPAEFIPLVENTSLSRPLTEWVLIHSIEQSARWYRQGLTLRVSINIAAANLEEEDFTQRLLGYLEQEQLPLNTIELELTESGLISNGRAAREQLTALMEAGLTIAIDDFGTGYSSLAYLQKIPAQVVKIDRTFIHQLGQRERNQTLVRAMLSMAHELGYRVVAEGVETAEDYHLLQAMNCDEVQGYLIAKPLSETDFEHWLAPINQTAYRAEP